MSSKDKVRLDANENLLAARSYFISTINPVNSRSMAVEFESDMDFREKLDYLISLQMSISDLISIMSVSQVSVINGLVKDNQSYVHETCNGQCDVCTECDQEDDGVEPWEIR